MTMKPKAPKFRIRRQSAPPPVESERGHPAGTAPRPSPHQGRAPLSLDGPTEDGFGDRAYPGSAKAASDAVAETTIAAIQREGLTGRQLRMARRLAQKQGLKPNSDFDAVRLLREQGIDPFDRSHMIELVHSPQGEGNANAAPAGERTAPANASEPGKGAAIAAATANAGQKRSQTNLPQTVPEKPKNLPGEHVPQTGPLGLHEIERIQRDIVRRRRRNIMFLVARLAAFVFLPTLLCMFYFAFVATQSYATKSEFIVQQAEVSGGTGGLLGGTAMATSQDSIPASTASSASRPTPRTKTSLPITANTSRSVTTRPRACSEWRSRRSRPRKAVSFPKR